MIEDSDIKTKVSPFAMREGEIKVFDGKDGYVSMNQILQKINLGQINDVHFKIIELVNKFEFLTSRQLLQLLEYENVEISNQDKLNKRLEQLIKCKILIGEAQWEITLKKILLIIMLKKYPNMMI